MLPDWCNQDCKQEMKRTTGHHFSPDPLKSTKWLNKGDCWVLSFEDKISSQFAPVPAGFNHKIGQQTIICLVSNAKSMKHSV